MTAVGLVAVTISLTFVTLALHSRRHRTEPGAVTYLGLTLLLAGMAAIGSVSGVGFSSDEQAVALVLAGWPVVALSWATFAFAYTGRGPTMTPRRTSGLLGAGVVITLGLLTAEQYAGMTQAVLVVIAPLLIGVFSLSMFGCFLMARTGMGTDAVPAAQSLALTGAGAGVTGLFLVGNLGGVVGAETALTGLVTMLGAVAAVLLAAQFRFALFETGPGTGYLAREAVLDQMSACVVLVDREGQLLDYNREAAQTFRIDRTTTVGTAIESVLGSEPTDDRVTLETAGGQREFDCSQSTLRNRHGRQVGQVYVLRDITERRTHEQRLAVLNRVLRHNLRNELDAIRGFAEAMPAVEQPEQLTTRISETATGLKETGETVARIERLLSRNRPAIEPVSLDSLASTVAAEANLTISTTAPELTIHTDPELLTAILTELVENAITHAETTTLTVELQVEPTETGAQIEVRDTGPGIPERERTVLLAGEETPLRHGSGLGLWFVYWGVTRLGGELTFDENSPRGSVVKIKIPNKIN